MTLDLVVLSSAALTGLFGSGHCASMCGGIAASLPGRAGQASMSSVAQIHAGRLAGYSLAGLLAGGLGHEILVLADSAWLGLTLRMLVGGSLILIALRLSGRRVRLPFASTPRIPLQSLLRPLYGLVLPANTAPRRIVAGALWGWLPCGLSASVLTAAWLRTGALQGSLTLLAFGIGGLPVMLSLSWSGARLGQRLQRGGWRQAGAALVMVGGLTTLLAPLLMKVPALQGALSALGCAHS